MSKAKNHPRPNQIAELTHGIELPFEPLHELHLKIIAELLEQAWSGLKKSNLPEISYGDETDISTLMEARLNNLVANDPLLSNLIHVVVRGKESVSYDATHIEKRPDLSIYLTKRSLNFPLNVECKLIDASSGKTVRLYCNDGLVRFVSGDYAWATREAFMLAYVRDSSSIKKSLIPRIKQHQKLASDPYLTEHEPKMTKHTPVELADSRHGRNFTYSSGSSPGPISLWHLWVS